jgi:hypothetical protein
MNDAQNECVALEAADCGADVTATTGEDLTNSPNFLAATKTCHAVGSEGCTGTTAYYNPDTDACATPASQDQCSADPTGGSVIYVSSECRAPGDLGSDKALCGSAFTPPKKINDANNACVDMEAGDCGEADDTSNQAKHGLDLSGKPNFVTSPAECHAAGQECTAVTQGVYNEGTDACD